MNWLKNIVPPKLRKLVGVQKEVPDNLWHSCPACSQMIFHRELVEKLYVCPKCDYHFRVSGKNRVTMLLDELSYNEVRVPTPTPDPLKFRDIKKYTEFNGITKWDHTMPDGTPKKQLDISKLCQNSESVFMYEIII
mgnify:CR=1 FL=1